MLGRILIVDIFDLLNVAVIASGFHLIFSSSYALEDSEALAIAISHQPVTSNQELETDEEPLNIHKNLAQVTTPGPQSSLQNVLGIKTGHVSFTRRAIEMDTRIHYRESSLHTARNAFNALCTQP